MTIFTARAVPALLTVLLVISSCGLEGDESSTPTTVPRAATVCEQMSFDLEEDSLRFSETVNQLNAIDSEDMDAMQAGYNSVFGQMVEIIDSADVWLEECADLMPNLIDTMSGLRRLAIEALVAMDSICRVDMEPLGFFCPELPHAAPAAPPVAVTPSPSSERPAWCVHDDRIQAELALQEQLGAEYGSYVPDWPEGVLDRLVQSVEDQGAAADRLWEEAPADYTWADVERECGR